MTRRTFTEDATGEKFEVIESSYAPYAFIMMPLPKPESEKETYILRFDKEGIFPILVAEDYPFTPEQAECVALAIKALMEWLYHPSNAVLVERKKAFDAAREAVQRVTE